MSKNSGNSCTHYCQTGFGREKNEGFAVFQLKSLCCWLQFPGESLEGLRSGDEGEVLEKRGGFPLVCVCRAGHRWQFPGDRCPSANNSLWTRCRWGQHDWWPSVTMTQSDGGAGSCGNELIGWTEGGLSLGRKTVCKQANLCPQVHTLPFERRGFMLEWKGFWRVSGWRPWDTSTRTNLPQDVRRAWYPCFLRLPQTLWYTHTRHSTVLWNRVLLLA